MQALRNYRDFETQHWWEITLAATTPHMGRAWLAAILFSILFNATAVAQQGSGYPPNIPDSTVATYKTVQGTDLQIWAISPEHDANAAPRPAIVFFFGGGWNTGSPEHFLRQANYFSKIGIVSFLADFRVISRNDTLPSHAVEDAISAMRWVRQHASDYHIDPQKIAAAGGSSGGHLALGATLLTDFAASTESHSTSAAPDAFILFNPVVMVDAVEGIFETPESFIRKMEHIELASISPHHQLNSTIAPALVFHGTSDTTVPFRTVTAFCEKSTALGNICRVEPFEGEEHGFFNYEPHLSTTLEMAQQFLLSLGWLESAEN